MTRPPAPPEGPRVLIVDDETLIAMMLEDLLLDVGCAVHGPAASVDSALELIAANPGAIDAAFLDINLRGDSVYPVAEALAANGVPFWLVTGYAEHGMEAPFENSPALTKPVQPDRIVAMLQQLTGLPIPASA